MAEKPLVITVHGINSDGEWQSAVQKVLEPHCQCEHFRYRDYRYAGFVLQLAGPRTVLTAMTLLGVCLGLLGPSARGWEAPWVNPVGAVLRPLAIDDRWSDLLAGALVFGLPAIVGMWFVNYCIKMAMQPEADPPAPPVFSRGLTIWGSGVVLLTVFGQQTAAPWFWLLPVFGIGLLLYSLGDFRVEWVWRLSNSAMFLIGPWRGDYNTVWQSISHAAGIAGVVWACLALHRREQRRIERQPWIALAKTWLVPAGLVTMCVWAGLLVGALARDSVHREYTPTEVAALVCGLTTVGAGIVWVAVAEAKGRRRNCVDRFRKSVRKWMVDHAAGPEHKKPIHVIAHSFGTYLAGETLILNGEMQRSVNEDPIRFHRVILVGSVLPSRYPWHDVMGEAHDTRVEQVRNEVGERDLVVFFAGVTEHHLRPLKMLGVDRTLLGGLRFGDAGRGGFRGNQELIHKVSNPLDYCELCCTREERAQRRIHNVHLPTFQHSDAFVAIERAAKVWLPFLLGLDPWEYWDFRRLCSQATRYERNRQEIQKDVDRLNKHLTECRVNLARIDRAEAGLVEDAVAKLNKTVAETRLAEKRLDAYVRQLSSIERQLGQRVWDWTYNEAVGKETLRQHITVAISDRIIASDQRRVSDDIKTKEADQRAEHVYAARTIKGMWEAVAQGLEAVAKLKDVDLPTDPAKIRLLSPKSAIERALEALPPEAFTYA